MVHHITSQGNCYDSTSQEEGERKYSSLPEEEQEGVEKILFLLDKFCVGDAFKQHRDELNKMCQIDPPHAKFEGAKVNSVETVFKDHISDFLKKNSDFDPITDKIKIKIKINGDGAIMTRNSNFILLSFSILQTGESVITAKGNRTLGIVSGSESYHTIKESFQSLFKEVNDLIATGIITVDGQEVKTEYYLSGDYKFILLMLGIKGQHPTTLVPGAKYTKLIDGNK